MTRQAWSACVVLGCFAGVLTGCTNGLRRDTPLGVNPAQELVANEAPATLHPSATEERVAALPPSPYSPSAAPVASPPPPVQASKPEAVRGPEIQKTSLHPTTVAPEPANQPAPVAPQQPRPLTLVPEPPKPVVDPPLVAALRCLLEKRSGDAVGQLSRYDKPTQDLLLCLLPALARLGEGGLDKATPEELAHLMAQLESALTTLRPRSALVIDKMCYCRDIDRYGVFEELPEQHPFGPGELVEVYVAVRNYSTVQHGDQFEIHLSSSLEIKDGDKPAQPDKKPVVREHLDRSRSPRHDHFFSYRFYVPENLPPGRYALQLKIADQLSPTKREAQRHLDLRVTTRPGT